MHDSSEDSCFDCAIVDVSTFIFELAVQDDDGSLPNVSTLSTQISKVLESELADDDRDQFERLVAEANGALRKHPKALPTDVIAVKASNSGIVVPSNPQLFTPLIQSAYRHFVGRRGSWLGLSELQVLAKRFLVSFNVYFESTNTFFDIEAMKSRDCIIRSHCLVFTGNHWEVGVVADGAVTDRISTNPLGDCSLEAFLTLLAITYPTASARLARRLWLYVDEYLKLRDTHCSGESFNEAVPANHAVVVTDKIRDFLKRGMGEHEIKDALGAVPGLRLRNSPSPSPSLKKAPLKNAPSKETTKPTLSRPGGRWGDYVAHVVKYFELTKALDCRMAEDQSFALVTNISQIEAASLLKKHGSGVATVLNLSSNFKGRLYRSASIDDGSKKPLTANLTHIGFMVAQIELADAKPSYFMCVIANFAAGRLGEKHPYMTTGMTLSQKPVDIPKLQAAKTQSDAELFSATDMHTECYSLFLLDRFIHGVLGANRVKSIEIEFVLQLDMCHRCRQAVTYFQQNHSCSNVDAVSAQSQEKMKGDIVEDVAGIYKRPPAMKAWNPFLS